MLVEQFQDVVNDRVLDFGDQVRLSEGGFRDSRTRNLAAELSDDLVEALLRAEALSFKRFHNRGHLSHIGDRRLFDRHGFACGAIDAHCATLSTSKVACDCAITP